VRATSIFSNPAGGTTSFDGDVTQIQPGVGSDEVNEASLHMIERQLAAFIGPLAKILVKRAAGKTTSVFELYTILVPSLEREEDRQAFLARRAEPAKGKTISPGITSAVPSLLTAPVDVSPSSEITPAVIEHAARRLAAHLGALAPILARKEAKRAASVRNFYELLAERVVDPAERARFMKDSGF
jgi:serine/threonine-protein kinase